MLQRFLILWVIVLILSFSFGQDYILTDLGNGIEKIEVEIITPEPVYVQDFPDTKVYLIRFKNKDLPVAAGMSGSPLVSNNRVLGALFAGYPFQKEPLAFVLPIEYMNSIKEGYAFKDSIFKNSKNLFNSSNSLIPLIINLPKNENIFYDKISNLFPFYKFVYSGVSVVDKDDKKNIDKEESVKEGSSISVALVDGDIKIFATGTLTKVDKDGYFTAFGHSFMNLGSFSAPVYKSKVITIVNRYDNPFKLTSITNKKVGSLVFDSNYGVLGKFGKEAQMIPLNIDIYTNGKKLKNYSCYVVDNNKITYLLSLISFYSVVRGYLESDLPYEFVLELGFINGRIQKINFPSINTPLEKILLVLYEYLNLISNTPSADNKLKYLNLSINIAPQNLGIINNISIIKKENNNIKFGINYYNPILKENNLETVEMVFPTESINEDLYFAIGGSYDLPVIFDQLDIRWTTPKDFNQLITFVNFFYTANPKTLLAVISTNLYGAIDYKGNIIPLNVMQLYKYYLQYPMPFIYLSYYPIIVRKEMNFVPMGYDIFKINVNGSISKAEREKKEKVYLPTSSLEFLFVDRLKENNSYVIIHKGRSTIEKELYETLKNYSNKNDSNTKQNKEDKEEIKEFTENSNIVNLSKYEDLIGGTQKNVSIDYQSNITFSEESYSEFRVSKNFFKILRYGDRFLGFYYNFDNTTTASIFDETGKIEKSFNFKGIFSDVRFSNNKIIASSFDGGIFIINPQTFVVEKNIKTDYIFQSADFYKNYIVGANIRYPSSIIFFSLDGKKIKEEILPFLSISKLVIKNNDIIVGCYGGIILKMDEKSTLKEYFQTYQEVITSLCIVEENIIIGTFPKPYLYIIPNDKDKNFNRPILYDGFGNSGYIEDIAYFGNKIFVSYKNNSESSVFSISKDELLGDLNNIYQKTNNLNWQKRMDISNFYWFNPFVVSAERIYIPYISNTFTSIGFFDKNSNHFKGEYVSKVFDLGKKSYLCGIIVNATGKFDCFVRMGNNPIVDQTWTDFRDYRNISNSSKYRYFQYKLIIYPETTVFSVLGVVDKVNYKPFFIVDLSKKFYNKEDDLSLNLWDPNGDKVKVILEYFYNGNWKKINEKIVDTKSTDVDQPDFSVNTSLELYNLPIAGKVKLRVSVNDSPSNFYNYFIQNQIFEIFIDNNKPIVKHRIIKGNSGVYIIEIYVEDESFVEVFCKIDQQSIPLKLKEKKGNVFKYQLKMDTKDFENKEIYVIAKDLAENYCELKIK